MSDYNFEMLEYLYNETERQGFGVIKTVFVEPLNALIEKGFVEMDPKGTDEAGNFRVACTDAGEAEVKSQKFKPMTIAEMAREAEAEAKIETPPFVTEQAMLPTNTVQLVTGLKPPPVKLKKGRSPRAELFPFSTMEPGTAFYIAPTIEIQKPEMHYKPLVNQKNQFYKKPVFDENGNPVMYERNSTAKGPRLIQRKEMTREFVIYPAKEVPNQPYQLGAYVFRLK